MVGSQSGSVQQGLRLIWSIVRREISGRGFTVLNHEAWSRKVLAPYHLRRVLLSPATPCARK